MLSKRASELRSDLTILLQAYAAALRVSEIELGFTPQQLFEAWLNGFVFHDDDPVKRSVREDLSRNPVLLGVAHLMLERTAFGLAKVALAMADLIAGFLDEDRLSALSRLSPKRSSAVSPADLAMQVRPYRRGGA